MSNNAASMRPSSFTNASKFTDLDVELQNCHLAEASYTNSDINTFAFLTDLTDLDTGETFPGMWSIGNVGAWAASEDGLSAIPTKDGGTFKKTCNFAMLIESLVKAGFNEDRIENAASFNGLRVHIVPKATGATDDEGKPRMCNVVGKILPNGLPWEASKRKSGGKTAKPTGDGSTAKPDAAKPKPAMDGEVKGLATLAVMAAITANGGTIARNKLQNAVMKEITVLNKDAYPVAKRGGIIAAIANEDVLGSLEGISYDGASLTIA
jgi:hypothetical protein